LLFFCVRFCFKCICIYFFHTCTTIFFVFEYCLRIISNAICSSFVHSVRKKSILFLKEIEFVSIPLHCASECNNTNCLKLKSKLLFFHQYKFRFIQLAQENVVFSSPKVKYTRSSYFNSVSLRLFEKFKRSQVSQKPCLYSQGFGLR
jgi:hypothetical protein